MLRQENTPNMSDLPASASKDCWHCSLVKYTNSYQTSSVEMESFSTYFLPGAIFITLALRWGLLLGFKWTKAASRQDLERAGLPPTPTSLYIKPLPWEGIVKLILTGLGIILTVAFSQRQYNPELGYVTDIRLTTIYLFFALSGLVDIFVFYCGYSVLPEGIQSFILSLAFAAEAVMFGSTMRREAPVELQVHLLLVLVVSCAALSSAMDVVFDNRLVKFCRTFFCFVQGTWLVHGGFLVVKDSSSLSSEWITILFSWHIAAIFIISITILLISSLFLQKSSPLPSPRSQSSSPHTTHTNSSPSSTSDLSFQQKHVPILSSDYCSKASTGLSVLPHQIHKEKCSTPSTGPPSIVEAEPCDQIYTSQEYSSLSGHVQPYRASVKLKESNLI